MSSDAVPEILRRAAHHGLDLDPGSVRVIEMGLDFRVAMVRDLDDRAWVLRLPRRASVMDRALVEEQLLRMVGPHLSAAVPDWRICAPDLIAYPLLPGSPGLELGEDGTPQWRVDVCDPGYVGSLARFLGELHTIPVDAIASSGIPVRDPEEVRASWARDIEVVSEQFSVQDTLLASWRSWLQEDALWPEHSVPCHGEIYPGHTLVEGSRIVGVIDWTTANVGDPAQDLMFHHATASPEAFEQTLVQYRERGGRTWPGLEQHCSAMFSAAPVRYGIYALETGESEHLEAAAAQLRG